MTHDLGGFGIYDDLFGIKAWLIAFLTVFRYLMERHFLLSRRNELDHYN